jgi:hypothetical protein
LRQQRFKATVYSNIVATLANTSSMTGSGTDSTLRALRAKRSMARG